MIYANNALNYLLFLPLYLKQTVHSVCAICHLHPDKIQKMSHSYQQLLKPTSSQPVHQDLKIRPHPSKVLFRYFSDYQFHLTAFYLNLAVMKLHSSLHLPSPLPQKSQVPSGRLSPRPFSLQSHRLLLPLLRRSCGLPYCRLF